MGSPSWGTDRPIEELLFTSGCEFDFFQAVRLLARVRSESKPVGYAAAPEDEIVRFRAKPSLAFPASAVHSIEEDSGGPPYMTIAFLGLTGPKGALPTYYTEMAQDQEFEGECALSDFLDLFNHRLISLFYRSWEKHHFPIGYEKARHENLEEDAFSAHLFDFIGMGTRGLRGRLPFLDQVLLRYAGLWAQRPHSASALEGILRDYFGVPVRIEQFRGMWHAIEEQDLCLLGSELSSSQLGMGAIAGDAVWSRQTMIRAVFGPLGLAQFRNFLPDGGAFRRAAAMMRLFLGDAIQFELQPLLRADEVPWCELGDDSAAGPRLGWSGWLKTEAFQVPAEDAVFAAREMREAGGIA